MNLNLLPNKFSAIGNCIQDSRDYFVSLYLQPVVSDEWLLVVLRHFSQNFPILHIVDDGNEPDILYLIGHSE